MPWLKVMVRSWVPWARKMGKVEEGKVGEVFWRGERFVEI